MIIKNHYKIPLKKLIFYSKNCFLIICVSFLIKEKLIFMESTEHQTHEEHKKHAENKNFITNVQETIWNNKKTIFFLLIIFILGMSVRANLVRYDGNYLFEPDASYHARMILNLVRDGSVPQIDELNYYQVEGGIPNQAPSLYWYISALIYFIIGFGQPFNKELLLFTIQFSPAIFGGLISIAMYFLAKEVFNDKKIGYIAGFIAAVSPAFVYRTMAGAQGDNSLGFLWMVIGFYYFVKAVKTKTLNKNDIINAILAGLFFLLMSMTWRMYILIPAILIPYALFAIVHIASTSKKEDFKHNEVIHFAAKFFLSFGIFSILYILFGHYFDQGGQFWLEQVAVNLFTIFRIDTFVIQIIIILLIALFFGIAFLISKTSRETKKMFETLVVVGLILGTIIMIGLFFIEPDLFYRGEGRTSISSMVGEESVGSQFFGTKYNSLIIFPWFAILLFPIGLYFFRKEDSHTQIMFFFWTIITLFMAWYKLKFTFVFGLGLVAGTAIACYLIFEALKKMNIEKGIEAKATTILLGFLLILGVGASAIFVPDYSPFPNSNPSQIDTMNWINENTANDAKFFNFWNEGHVLSLHTERKFSSDNRNSSGEANSLYSEFNITTDVNRGYEIATKEIGTDYIYLETDNINSLGTFEYYFAGKVDSRLAQKYYVGTFTTLDCYESGTVMVCGGNQIPKTEFEKISTTWKNTPDAFPDGKNPAYYYRNGSQILILNQAINNTNLAKVLLNSEETKNLYETVFSSGSIRIIKVLK